MTTRDTEPRSAPSDDWLDRLLADDAAAHRDAYIDDDGFTARAMASLPAPATLPAWRRPVVAGLWTLAGAGVATMLPSTILDVAHEALHLLVAQPFTLYDVAGALALLGVASWTGALVALRRD